MSYYPSDPVFLTQGEPLSLTNILYRTRVARILADADNQVAAVIQRQTLKVVTVIEQRVIDGYVTVYSLSANQKSILERLRLPYTNAMEMSYLVTVLAALTPVLTYDQTVTALNPLLWYKFNEAATPAVNNGSVGSAADGTVANMTFEVAGPNATIPKAYTYNGTTSLITVGSSALLQSLDYTIACLINEVDKGESSLGAYFEMHTTAPAVVCTMRHSNSLSQFVFTVTNAAGSGQSWISSTDITFGAWAWAFMQFNSTTGKVRAWKSVASVLTAFTMGTDPTFTGTPRQIGTGYVGNDAVSGRTINGKYAQFMLFGSLLSTDNMQAIITKSGV